MGAAILVRRRRCAREGARVSRCFRPGWFPLLSHDLQAPFRAIAGKISPWELDLSLCPLQGALVPGSLLLGLLCDLFLLALPVTEQAGVVHDKLLQKGSPLSLSGCPPTHTHLLGSKCPPPEERRLPMPETGEKERNYLFKSYTDLE